MGDRGSVPIGVATIVLGLISAVALAFVHVEGSYSWWAAVAWCTGLAAFVGGLATVGTRWVGDPWFLSQQLGAIGAGLALVTGLAAFAVLVAQPTSVS
jgi:hypothetical protein